MHPPAFKNNQRAKAPRPQSLPPVVSDEHGSGVVSAPPGGLQNGERRLRRPPAGKLRAQSVSVGRCAKLPACVPLQRQLSPALDGASELECEDVFQPRARRLVRTPPPKSSKNARDASCVPTVPRSRTRSPDAVAQQPSAPLVLRSPANVATDAGVRQPSSSLVLRSPTNRAPVSDNGNWLEPSGLPVSVAPPAERAQGHETKGGSAPALDLTTPAIASKARSATSSTAAKPGATATAVMADVAAEAVEAISSTSAIAAKDVFHPKVQCPRTPSSSSKPPRVAREQSWPSSSAEAAGLLLEKAPMASATIGADEMCQPKSRRRLRTPPPANDPTVGEGNNGATSSTAAVTANGVFHPRAQCLPRTPPPPTRSPPSIVRERSWPSSNAIPTADATAMLQERALGAPAVGEVCQSKTRRLLQTPSPARASPAGGEAHDGAASSIVACTSHSVFHPKVQCLPRTPPGRSAPPVIREHSWTNSTAVPTASDMPEQVPGTNAADEMTQQDARSLRTPSAARNSITVAEDNGAASSTAAMAANNVFHPQARCLPRTPPARSRPSVAQGDSWLSSSAVPVAAAEVAETLPKQVPGALETIAPDDVCRSNARQLLRTPPARESNAVLQHVACPEVLPAESAVAHGQRMSGDRGKPPRTKSVSRAQSEPRKARHEPETHIAAMHFSPPSSLSKDSPSEEIEDCHWQSNHRKPEILDSSPQRQRLVKVSAASRASSEPRSQRPAPCHEADTPQLPSPAVSPPAPQPGSSGATAHDAGVVYLKREDLKPLSYEPDERLVADVVGKLSASSTDWAAQFAAVDEVRRFVAFTPQALLRSSAGGRGRNDLFRLKTVMEYMNLLAESLRSAVAKNALRCVGELFLSFGARLDGEIEATLSSCLRRAADTNRFIVEEADQTLRAICAAASEGKLLGPLHRFASHKSNGIRNKAMWCVAMIIQRLGVRALAGREAPALAKTIASATGDASPDVRAAARVAAVAIMASTGEQHLASRIGMESARRIRAAVPQDVDLSTFDACSPEALQRAQGLRKTALPRLVRTPPGNSEGNRGALSRNPSNAMGVQKRSVSVERAPVACHEDNGRTPVRNMPHVQNRSVSAERTPMSNAEASPGTALRHTPNEMGVRKRSVSAERRRHVKIGHDAGVARVK